MGCNLNRRHGLFLQVFRHNRIAALPTERTLACGEFVERDAQRVQVSAAIHVLAANLFGRHVIERTHGGARNGDLLVGGGLGNAEVQ